MLSQAAAVRASLCGGAGMVLGLPQGVGDSCHSVLYLTTVQMQEHSPSHTRVQRNPRGTKTCVYKYISLQAWLNLLYFLHGCSKSATRVKPVMFHSFVCVCESVHAHSRWQGFIVLSLCCDLPLSWNSTGSCCAA